MSLGQIFGIVFTLLCSALISLKGDPGCIWAQCILITMAIVAVVLSFFVKEDLRRLNEARQNTKKD